MKQAPALAATAKELAGIAPERSLAPFARRSFRQWFHGRPRRNDGGPRVLLWPDTFNDPFFPDTAIAATEELEWAGYEVILPARTLCCGRPLYDFGFLKTVRWCPNLPVSVPICHAQPRETTPVRKPSSALIRTPPTWAWPITVFGLN
ncbi:MULTISPECIES: hypothetical protein [Sorangium]|uniref:hypothetical protein n=1 Tax=Sorangium TaxID=39643 RepID=UPI003D9C47BE